MLIRWDDLTKNENDCPAHALGRPREKDAMVALAMSFLASSENRIPLLAYTW